MSHDQANYNGLLSCYGRKCRLVRHNDFTFSAIINISEGDTAKVRAILPQLCSNFARVADHYGRTALHLAASCGKCDILEWLVKEHGADLDFKDLESGWTALHRSVFYGYLDCMVKLIQLGSDLSSFDTEGLSPLDLIQLDSPFQITPGDYPLELFTWGSNTNFTLGHRDESTRHAPEMLDCLQGDVKLCIKEVVMCKFHSVFLSVDGKVFTCGHGRGGRLGQGNEKTLLEPQEVAALKEVKCVSIAAGQDHTLAVTEDGSVYSFGLNDSHQLGQSPPPKQCLSPKMVQVKLWRGKHIIGAAAGRYHSVFFSRNEVYSCGLNAGQLGHPKGENYKYQTLPRQVSGLADKNVVISKVSCSDGATVCATVKGDIFLLNLYTCRRIISRFADLTRLAVIGGKLDMVESSQEVSNKFADELAVTVLNSRGMVFQWKPKFSSLRECCWFHNRLITVRDFAIGKQLLVVSGDGEAFICQPARTNSSPIKADSKKSSRSPSISPKPTENTIAQSPPTSSSLSNVAEEKDVTLAHSSPETSPLSLLAKGRLKKDTVVYRLERIPFIHRGLRVFTDSKSRGYAVLQIAAKEGLNKLPQVSKIHVWQHLTQLLEETTCEDDIHDVEFLVKGQTIPAHSFVIASRSPKCHQLMCEYPGVSGNKTRTIVLHNSIDYSVVMSWLKRLYNGEEISDKELFLKDVTFKGKNGFHGIGKNKKEKEISSETDKTYREKKILPECDEEDMNTARRLAYLVYLAKRDLDDFTSPSFDDDDDDELTLGDLGERLVLDAVDTKKMSSTSESKTSTRNDKDADSSSSCKSMTFSRSDCPELYDVVIVSEDETELQCHKCILVSRLEYFRSMLASGWLEASQQSKTLKLPFPTVILDIVLDFLYSGKAVKVEEITDLELLGHVLIVADQLLICRLREICEAVIANLVTLKNVTEVLEFSLLYNANQLRDVCTEFITNNLATLMEARTLDSLSDEALAEVSRAYRSMVSGMAWRVITPSNLHDALLSEIPEPSHGKRRKSGGRKKSSKSDSEQDANIPETVQEDHGEAAGRSSFKEMEEVFDQQETAEYESAPADKSDEACVDLDSPETDEQAPQEAQGALSQVSCTSGLWYRKQTPDVTIPKKRSPDVTIPKKRSRDRKQSADKSVDGLNEQHRSPEEEEEEEAKKVPSSEKPAWNSKTSMSSPPPTSLKDIIEQEKSQAVCDVDSLNEKISPTKETANKSPLDQRLVTSPQGGARRWNSGSRQSQKQRKLAINLKCDNQVKSTEGNTNDGAGTGKEEKTQPAWGGVSKGPAPVQSLRDLMQEEEQRQSGKKSEILEMPNAATSSKSGSARKKLNWRPQPGFCATNSDLDAQENVDIDHEVPSGLPLSPPKSVWQSTPMACSPPSSSVAFSTILESQEQENTNLNKVSKKPFHLTQLEERAMEELLQYYGGTDNACEFVTVQRVPSTAARPVWKKERSPAVNPLTSYSGQIIK